MAKNVCSTCGREFQTGQALGSHKFYGHGQASETRQPLRRFITDLEIIELFKKRDASMADTHKAILDVSKRTLSLLAEIRRLDGEIGRIDGEIAELRQDPVTTKV